MKNVDKLYEKYCNFYKNDFDNDDKKKKKRKKLTASSLNCLIRQTKS